MGWLRRRGRLTLAATALLLAVAGAVLLIVGFTGQQHAPRPPTGIAGSYALASPSGAISPPSRPAQPSASTPRAQPPAVRGPVLPASIPTRLRIPAIGVDSDLVQLGLNPDGTVAVPPLARDSRPGWYRYSPTPGQLGPSIILGHIDSAAYGPGVFFRLGALRPGDVVSVTRADGTVAEFRVDAVAQYPKDHFPTLTVYGNTDHAALRLITCGGRFDFSAHSYEDNVVAFASLVASHPKGST